MGYDVVTMEDCASNFATYEIIGSRGDRYRVTLSGSESYGYCPCKGFQVRRDCSHMKKIWAEACLYNPQWHDGGPAALKPVEYDERFGFNADGHCPSCGGPTIYVRRAV